MRLIAICTLLVLPSFAQSATLTDAKVLSVGTYGSGRLFIVLDKVIAEPGCNYAQVHIDAGHSQLDTWMSIALAALASGALVSVTTDGCLGTYPTMNNGLSTNFRINSG